LTFSYLLNTKIKEKHRNRLWGLRNNGWFLGKKKKNKDAVERKCRFCKGVKETRRHLVWECRKLAIWRNSSEQKIIIGVMGTIHTRMIEACKRIGWSIEEIRGGVDELQRKISVAVNELYRETFVKIPLFQRESLSAVVARQEI